MISVIGVVKNAADIIESMIRCNAIWADNFVLLDNMSSDRTAEILESLKKEGFPIEVLEDHEQSHLQKEKMLKLIAYVKEKYSPDFIFPLDDDEIVVSSSAGLKPGEIKSAIEGLDRSMLYYVSWRNYIPADEDDAGEVCVPKRLRFCFDDEPRMTKKVLIPAALTGEGFSLADGNHYADSPAVKGRVHLKDLRIAHFPVRSPEQIASKAAVGWINNLIINDRAEGQAYHWERMFNIIKGGTIPGTDLMQAMCTLYREDPNDEEHLNVVLKPLDLPAECFTLRYTRPGEANLLANICRRMEELALAYSELKKKV
ncbi:MAG: glycosyltransferase family 2 protein [Lachnospiraceae bacterium]|nr:glycosyltransferase family 2 protein [Lachnospiraceae bacterium]